MLTSMWLKVTNIQSTTLCIKSELSLNNVQVQLIRIQMRVPELGWRTQKVFHLMNFVVNGCKVLDIILLDLPGLLFFSTYTLLVLFWAEIYHQYIYLLLLVSRNPIFQIQARSLPTDKLRPAYFIINGVVYFLQVCIWIYMRFSNTAAGVELAELFFSVISLGAAVGFVVYGGRLFVMLKRFPVDSSGRQKKLQEVGFVTGICCTCFLIRCVMVAIAAFDKNADIHVLNHPILDFAYYMIVEILPSALVLFILRKLPPRRVSDQYHPIN
ncbi:hypothetical protein Hanom_Chr12g01124281 [Helianthus anomalus]